MITVVTRHVQKKLEKFCFVQIISDTVCEVDVRESERLKE